MSATIPFPTFPHLPDVGDQVPGRTHEAVGELIHLWEMVEFDLSRTFSAVMGHPDGRIIPFLGEQGRIFQERLRILKVAVDHEFVVRPNQALEGQFAKLVDAATWYADRRNEVAHTIVNDLMGLPDFANRHKGEAARSHYFAIPPLYAFTKREKDREAKRTPPYAYSSTELHTLCLGLIELIKECRRFRYSLFPNEWPEEQRDV